MPDDQLRQSAWELNPLYFELGNFAQPVMLCYTVVSNKYLLKLYNHYLMVSKPPTVAKPSGVEKAPLFSIK